MVLDIETAGVIVARPFCGFDIWVNRSEGGLGWKLKREEEGETFASNGI